MIDEDRVKKVAEFNGIEFYRIPADKFKTFTFSVYFCDSLNKERVSYNALIPFVLRRGSKEYPTSKKITEKLQELYGASFYSDVSKKGEVQATFFSADAVNAKYANRIDGLFSKLIDFIFGIITDPVLEKGVFKKDYVEQEKKTLIDLVESRKNDKGSYAVQRCFEEMCKGEAYSIFEAGTADDIKSIDEKSLYEYYTSVFLKRLPIKIFVTGEVSEEDFSYLVSKFKELPRDQIMNISSAGEIKPAGNEVKNVTDKMNVIQGKLCLGFRTNISPQDDLYFPLTICNTIYGGGIHSKLFQYVREKASLAYYASSHMDKFKGVMIVTSGIDIANKEKAQKIMLEQLEEIKKGNISDFEFNSAMKTYVTAVNLLKDGQRSISDFFLGQTLLGLDYGLSQLLERLEKVTIEDVAKAAQKIQLDTVYFLTA